ncbi:MAG: Glu-tRNA(Gln) amidotransferase subunit GatE [Candidatus Lokiarchaeota archaeon]|nr:Glu-tRNA(Gln) amidotransferase subunit GatE [Candidatus Lokiarchaeota archaeon]
MVKLDYQKIGLKCGLEIHQQLDSKTKLFCRCPNELQGTREPDFTVKRTMRPVLGEMGKYDEAMLTEYQKGLGIVYECYNDVICTYELDETPPFLCSIEAKHIALEIALLLNSKIIEEMHVCRKNYLDGSVPCGFQRTMILAKDGFISLENGKKISIDIVCLEEDAARKTKFEKGNNYYRLDRLGIPLVEITTNPDISHPEECRECAERLGLLLWSTKVKKVLGSIRQDINVSITGGTRIEIKGVQKLDWIPLLIDREIERQQGLLWVSSEIKKRGLNILDVPEKPIDLSRKLVKSTSKFISNGIKNGKKIYGVNFPGFKGLFGKELMTDYRFGTEVSSKVKAISGLKGIIHSDENLDKYKFTEADIKTLKENLFVQEGDCFLLVLGNKEEVEKAIDVAIERIKKAFQGVPPETRRALEDGRTEFLRELHGGARLYPDTDSQAIYNEDKEILELKKKLPAYPWDTIKNYSKKFHQDENMIKDLIFSDNLGLFEILIKIYPDNPTKIVTTLLQTTTALRRDGKQIENIGNNDFIDIFTLLKNGEISNEAVEELMIAKADNPNLSIRELKGKLNIEIPSEEEIEKKIKSEVNNNEDLIKNRKMGALGPLMGPLMKEFRNKIDGKIISEMLKKHLQKKIKELGL